MKDVKDENIDNMQWSKPDTIELLATAKQHMWLQQKNRDAFIVRTSGQKKFGWREIILHFMRTKKGFLLYSCETDAGNNSCLLLPATAMTEKLHKDK